MHLKPKISEVPCKCLEIYGTYENVRIKLFSETGTRRLDAFSCCTVESHVKTVGIEMYVAAEPSIYSKYVHLGICKLCLFAFTVMHTVCVSRSTATSTAHALSRFCMSTSLSVHVLVR